MNELIFGKEARERLMVGVDKIANAVKVTLGPKGNVVVIQTPSTPHVTKDGVTVAKAVELKDPVENMGAELIKTVANRSNEVAGDGTTTSTVITQAILKLIMEKYEENFDNRLDIKVGMEKAVKFVLSRLSEISQPVDSNDKIKQVATISANNDEFIGGLISEAFDKVGKDGVITVELAKGVDSSVKVEEGFQFESGFLSPYFVTDIETQVAELKNPYILLTDNRLVNGQELIPILNKVASEKRSLLIVADAVEGEALSTLVLNKTKGLIEVCAIKAPFFGYNRTDTLEDLAIITGGTLINSKSGLRIEDIELEHLGQADKVSVRRYDTTILGSRGNQEDIDNRVKSIKASLKDEHNESIITNYTNRIGRIVGGIGVLYVGGSTEIEVKETKDRVDDALNATKAAIKDGIIPGGGLTLYKIGKELIDSVEADNEGEKEGIRFISEAIKVPFKTIIKNSGKNLLEVEKSINKKEEFGYGFDVRGDKYCDLIKNGVVDPTKVTKTAIENSFSVCQNFLFTECVIYSPETVKPSFLV